jgi:hypothetical protein
MKKVQFSLPPIAEKVTSIFHPRTKTSPVFNQPLNTTSCPHHRISRLLYSISLTILLIIAIPVMTLKAMTYSFIEDNRMTGFTFKTTERDGEPGESIVMAALPKMLYPVPAKLALVAAAISILLGAAHLGFVGIDWKNGKRVRTPLPQAKESIADETIDAKLRFPPQHHVPAHHQRNRRPLRPRQHLLHPQKHLSLPRQLRQLPRLTHERHLHT